MNTKTASTTAYYLAFIILGMVVAAEGPAIPWLAQHTASKIEQISLIFVFGSFGYMVGSYIGGRLYDRIPGHRFMSLVMLALALAAALVPVASSLPILLVILLVFGITKGALDVGGNTLLLWIHGAKVGPYMNGLHASFGVGSFTSGLIAARVIGLTGDIYWIFWTFAILCLPLAIWLWFIPNPAPRATPEEHKDTPLPLLPVLVMVMCFVVYVGAETGYGSWLYTYAIKLGLENEVTAAYLTSAFWGFFTLGRLIGIPISTRLRPRLILFADLAGCILSLGIILIWRDSAPALWVGSILLGIALASIFPTLLTLAEERMHITGAITGWFLVGSGLGGMILPWGIGQLFDNISPTALPIMVMLSVVVNILTITWFVNIKKQNV
jgi:FHS family Na+ dependent glucose MFS transporter 1